MKIKTIKIIKLPNMHEIKTGTIGQVIETNGRKHTIVKFDGLPIVIVENRAIEKIE
jgi:hypothetical protein